MHQLLLLYRPLHAWPKFNFGWVAMQCDDEPGRETRLLHASKNEDDDAHGDEHRRQSNLEKNFHVSAGRRGRRPGRLPKIAYPYATGT